MKIIKIHTHHKIPKLKSKPSKQRGVAILGMVIFLMIMVGAVAMLSSKSTVLETKMVFNLQDKQRSFLAAESVALYAWDNIKSATDITEIIDNSLPGYYALGDKIVGSSKSREDWDVIKNVTQWPWTDDSLHFNIPEQIGGSSNPMKLIANPQYTIGAHNAVIRKGISNYRCVPVTIIGASQGGTAQTRTLIELKAVPKSTCYYDKIK